MSEGFSACFVNTLQKPIKTIHLGWIANINQETASLSEIVEEWYLHPDAPDCSYIQLTNIHIRECCQINDPKAAKIELLKHAQDNISLISIQLLNNEIERLSK